MKNKLLLAAIAEGSLLVGMELMYAQLAHPFYGQSYYVWLVMLAITMLGSGIGYIAGGQLTRFPDSKIKLIVSVCLVFIGLYFLLIFGFNEFLSVKLQGFSLFTALIYHSLLVLLVPVILITLNSPIIVKYYSLHVANSGKSSGTVFFSSTIGGVISIYALAFFILPAFDLIGILHSLGLLVLVISVLFLMQSSSYTLLAANVIIFMLVYFGVAKNQNEITDTYNTKVLYRNHGIMGELEIRDEYGEARYISLNRMNQSAIDIKFSSSLWTYPYRVLTYASVKPARSDVLVAGYGGGVLINLLIELGFAVDCVEFDSRMYPVSRKYLNANDAFNLKVDDFRHHINVTNKKYDLIILDLSRGESIPANVYTVESFRRILELLNPGGFVILHYFSDIPGMKKNALYSLMKTMDQSGAFFALAKKNEGDQSPEQLLFMSNDPQIIVDRGLRIPKRVVTRYNIPYNNFMLTDIDYSSGQILTDDKNNLEKIQLDGIVGIRKERTPRL
ncbi:MAG: fused MFS/spermidine synthase [Gammaproteobacteria bacterium]|nr:fused MFS/spermidine synthase [Gammaproteobacteria bacterium]MCW8922498.1 fused MFS/spermidine synthase [Gammaproteobacteria bacterium]